MVELCRSSFSDIIDKLKADLAYFKDNFWNKDMFEVIHKPTSNKPHPRTGHGASMPKLLDIPSGSPGTTTLRGNPPQMTPVPPPRTTPAPPPRQTPVPSPRSTPTGPLGNAPVPPPWPVPWPRMTTSSRNQPWPQPQPQPQPTPEPKPDGGWTWWTPSPNPPPSNNMVPNNRVKSEHGHTSGKRKGQTKSTGKPPMCLRCGRNSHTKYYCKDHKVSCRHCKSQTHASHCCAFIPKATSTSNGETSDTASTNGWSQWTHLPGSPCKQKKKPKNQERQKGEHTQKPQAQQNDNGAHTVPHQVNRNTQLPPQGQQQYFYPLPHNRYPSMVRLWSSKTPALLLHSDRWLNCISNTSRQAKLRLKLLRTLPVPHHSCPQ